MKLVITIRWEINIVADNISAQQYQFQTVIFQAWDRRSCSCFLSLEERELVQLVMELLCLSPAVVLRDILKVCQELRPFRNTYIFVQRSFLLPDILKRQPQTVSPNLSPTRRWEMVCKDVNESKAEVLTFDLRVSCLSFLINHRLTWVVCLRWSFFSFSSSSVTKMLQDVSMQSLFGLSLPFVICTPTYNFFFHLLHVVVLSSTPEGLFPALIPSLSVDAKIHPLSF